MCSKRFFEYKFNDTIKQKLIDFYQQAGEEFGNDGNELKIQLKINRIENQIEFHPDDVICDVGCSGGALLRFLRGKYKQGIGLDISREVINNNILNNKDSKIVYKAFDGINLEETNLDKVFLFDVLEHAFEPDDLINSIYSSLKPNGQLIMQVPSTGWLSEFVFGKYHLGHLRYYDESYLKNYLIKHGFEIKYLTSFNSVPFSSRLLRYKNLYKICDALVRMIPHILYPYYGSVVAIGIKNK